MPERAAIEAPIGVQGQVTIKTNPIMGGMDLGDGFKIVGK
jgi:hypothetical protein